jgi:hypothetical protein
MKVNNVEGTSDNTCKCGSWLKHWQKYGGAGTPSCSIVNCGGTHIVGVHVQQDSATDKSWYVVPLCTGHDGKATSLTIKDGVTLASANVSQTCGRA